MHDGHFSEHAFDSQLLPVFGLRLSRQRSDTDERRRLIGTGDGPSLCAAEQFLSEFRFCMPARGPCHITTDGDGFEQVSYEVGELHGESAIGGGIAPSF